MQYLLSVIHDSSELATDEEAAAITAFDERIRQAGSWVFAGGLGDPAHATVVDNRQDAGLIVDGPFVETKEWLVGFWIIRAPDLDAALALAREASTACNRKVEVRPFLRT